MKRSMFAMLLSSVLGLVASSVSAMNADEYKIEICTIPLNEIVVEEAKAIVGMMNLQHMFVRGTENGKVTGLNFEPTDKSNYMGSSAMIGQQNYSTAKCATLVATSEKSVYDDKFSAFVVKYEAAAQTLTYNALGNNCQTVTEKIMIELDYEMPLEITQAYAMQNMLTSLGRGLLQNSGDGTGNQKDCVVQ